MDISYRILTMKWTSLILLNFLFLTGCVTGVDFAFDIDACPPQNYLIDTLCLCPEARFNNYQCCYDYERYNALRTPAYSGSCGSCTGSSGCCGGY